MLIQRVVTAAILAPLAVGAILHLPPSVTGTLFAIVLSIATWEWANLTRQSSFSAAVWALTFLGTSGVLYSFGFIEAFGLTILVATNLLWLGILIVVLDAKLTSKNDLGGAFSKFLRSPLIGVVLLLGALIGAVELLNKDPVLLLLLFVVVWSADIGAYFAGRRWGKHKLAASISPGKTWEGVVGGIALSAIIIIFAAEWIILSNSQRTYLILFGLFSSAMSVFGDLFESLLKRSGGFKDSGRLLPGHGGVLDRIDGLIAAIPIYSLSVLLWVSKL